MSWIRLRNVKITAGVFVALWLFCWLALGPLIRWGMVRAGEAAAGARVDAGPVHVELLRGKLTVDAVAVANKNEPLKNLFEFQGAELSFSPGAALRGKIVIPTAELRGLQFGTPRKSSGALTASKPGLLQKQLEKQLAPAEEHLALQAGKAQKTVQVSAGKLESLKGLDAAKDQLDKTGGDLKKKVGVQDLDARIKDVEADIKQLQGGGKSAADLARKAQLAADTQKKIRDLLDQVDKSRAAVKAELAGVQAKLNQADDLRHKDVNGLLAAAGLPTLDAQSLTRHLLGPATADKIGTAIYWISWFRKRAASQPQKAREKPEKRRQGVDFEFPRSGADPAFLLEQARLTGSVEKLFQGRDMALEGLLTGVTSNPPLYGKPARLTLSGATAGGGPDMKLLATVDQVKEPGATELTLHYAGLPLSGLGLGDDQLGAALKSGAGTLDGGVKIVGDEWKGSVTLRAGGVSLAPKTGLSGPAAGYAAAALSGIRAFTVTIGISGKEDALHFDLRSDLGQTLADGMKKAFSGELEKQRKDVEAKVDALYAARRQQLQGQADSLQKQLLAPLDKQQAQLQEQLKKAVAKGLGNPFGKFKFK